jgi:hypothetical protein
MIDSGLLQFNVSQTLFSSTGGVVPASRDIIIKPLLMISVSPPYYSQKQMT